MNTPCLVLCGDAWHPAETIRTGLLALAEPRLAFEFSTDGYRWTPALLDQFPVAIVAKGNHLSATDQNHWLTTGSQSAFRKFVQRGGGALFLHAGTGYRELPEMRSVTGGAFMRHPDPCAVTFEPRAGHPLTTDVATFTETDEHYLMALDAPDAEVFLHSHSEHGTQPAGWTRTEGAGRVGVLTPGHAPAVWRQPAFQKLLLNVLRWTARLN